MIQQHRRAARTLRTSLQAALLTLVFASLAIPLAALTAPDAPPPLNGIAHIAIRVHSLAASTAFYEQLGFEQAFTRTQDGVTTQAFLKINDSQFIELYPVTEKDPAIGFLHLCFEGVDLNAIHDDYTSRGLTPKPVRKAGAGNLLFTLVGPLQPFGPQNIEYTQYEPGSLHTLDQGKHLGPDRVADKLLSVTLAMQDPAAARDFYVNSLEFKPVSGSPMKFHLAGDSGEQIEIVAASPLGDKASITLETDSLSKSGRILRKQHIAATKKDGTLTVTDPDGNIIHIQSH
jgi:catechol 2,3-dioxygenase-like lactoylglutathione lyase family enzyme